MEIQNLVNPKSEPVKPNSKQYQFLFKYISKNQWQLLKLTEKPFILWSF